MSGFALPFSCWCLSLNWTPLITCFFPPFAARFPPSRMHFPRFRSEPDISCLQPRRSIDEAKIIPRKEASEFFPSLLLLLLSCQTNAATLNCFSYSSSDDRNDRSVRRTPSPPAAHGPCPFEAKACHLMKDRPPSWRIFFSPSG